MEIWALWHWKDFTYFTFCCSIPSKKWKCSFEETLQLQSISDWLQEIAAVFAESQFFDEIHALVTVRHGTPVVKNHERLQHETDVHQHVTTCNGDRDTNASCVSDLSNSECPTIQNCTEMTSDLHLTAATVPQYVGDTAVADSSVTVTATDRATVDKDVSVLSRKQQKSSSTQKKTRHKAASKVHRRTRSRKTKALLPDDIVDGALTTGGSSISAGNAQYNTNYDDNNFTTRVYLKTTIN